MEVFRNLDSVSFKAYLKRNGQDVEVRRFGIDAGAVTSYMYLRGKIQSVFPSLQNDQFTVFWQDNEQDYIVIDSDEELRQALLALVNQMPIKLYVHVKSGSTPQGGNEQLHPGVTCDGCEGAMVGYRYKCVTCPDFDLCSTCETSKLHPEHFMLRIPAPLMGSIHSKFFRKFFGRSHKFHKRHGWFRMPEAQTFCENQGPMGSGHCPFSRREGPTAPGPVGMTDMFDFSALLEFINSLGIPTAGESEANDASARAQASCSSQTQQNQSATSQTQSSQTNTQEPRRSNDSVPNPGEYLTSVGQAIVNFLDPLGVNVTFDVRPPKQAEAKKQATSQQTTPTTPSQKIFTNASTSVPEAANASTSASPATPVVAAATAPASTPATAIPVTPVVAAATAPASAPATAIPVTPGFMAASTPASVGSGFAAAGASASVSSVAQMETPQSGSPPNRRNSDDWTLLNRESPTCNEDEVAMDVDESRGAKPKIIYPELPKEAPSAPPPTDAVELLDIERERIQEAIERIRSMGFNFESTVLRDLLAKQNCDIASVLEIILCGAKNLN